MVERESESGVARASLELRPSVDQLWAWLAEVPDPEIPAVSIVDLGIVRGVSWSANDSEAAEITVTPTYSGCPATEMIAQQIRQKLHDCGMERVELRVQLSPPWTTDWLTDKGKEKLRAYGIAPPTERSAVAADGLAASLVVLRELGGGLPPARRLACPRCGSVETETISQFGSTPCKSLHRCLDCLEPFDHFKCH